MCKTNWVDKALIEVRPGRIRSGLISKGRLVELIVDDLNFPSLVGNIYQGRIEKVVHSLNAFFVDIGIERSGFLPMTEVVMDSEKSTFGKNDIGLLCEGDKIIVQVKKDPIEFKGPKLTTNLTLISPTVILKTGENNVKISRRIHCDETRLLLKSMIDGIANSDEGFIARTAAAKAPEQVIKSDITMLREEYLEILNKSQKARKPIKLLHCLGSVERVLRDLIPINIKKIIIDDAPAFLIAKRFVEKRAPALKDLLQCYKGTRPLFEDEKLIDDIEQAMSAEVKLPSGGSLIFSETPALIAIDVNTAGTSKGGHDRSSFETNLEAAAEIARQIRLRNLSGLFVIDFVSMKSQSNKDKVQRIFKKFVSSDSETVFVGGFTRFGLMEFTRRRGRPSLNSILSEVCEYCNGKGSSFTPITCGFRALDRLRVECKKQTSRGMELKTSKAIAKVLKGELKSALYSLEIELGKKISIIEDGSYCDEYFEIICRGS